MKPARRTRYPGLGYTQVLRDLWRVVDMSTGAHVGPHYRTKTELMADLPRYAQDNWGMVPEQKE